MMSLNNMRKEASECNDAFLRGDFKTPYELFLSLIKDRENKIKKTEQDVLDLFIKLIEHYSGDFDCVGFKEHKIRTTNTCFDYPLDGDKKLMGFGQECFLNGWLQLSEVLKQKLKGEKSK